MKKRYYKNRAAALIIVLATLVLASILVVGLTIAMRMERSASFYNLERTRADLIARQGIDTGSALLLEATPTNRFWVSGPGLAVASPPGEISAPTAAVVLSSGYTSDTNTDVSANLNRSSLSSGDRILDPSGGSMNYKWIYLQRDGSYATNKTPSSVGRFAFWADDLSARVNLNTADTRSATGSGNPSQVTLGALPDLMPFSSAIAASALANPFTTPFEVMGRNDSWTNALFKNRFLLTYYNQDPDVNPWGESRIVLTTKASDSTNRPFLQILGSENSDPGVYANLSATNLRTTYLSLAALLNRTNWPYAPGNSFTTKFGTGGITQLSLDIIEYVRTTESTRVWPEPIFATASTNTFTLLPATSQLDSLAGTVFVGTVRRPMLSQVGVFCSTNTNSTGTGFLGTLHVQTWLPTTYRAGGNTFSGWTVWAQIASTTGTATNTISAPLGPMIFSGGYASGSLANIDIPANVAAGIPTNTMVRVALLKNTAPAITNVLDVAPLKQGDFVSFPTGTNLTAYSTVNDPRVNKYPANWQAFTNLVGDVGPVTHQVNYSAYGSVPASDGSADGVYFRSTNSRVASVGELGYVATGISSSPAAPWRSLRLQVNSSSNVSIPPDWAVVDLFSAPIDSRFVSGTNLVAGRVNLNSYLRDSLNLTRTNVLNALFTNVSGVAPANISSIVDSVVRVQLASAGKNYGQATNNTNFVSVGQLCEIANIGDKGELGENLIRDVVSLSTVRGNVFAVYSCGQAISVNDSKVTVNGEKFLCSIVERYFDQSGNVKFRTISWNQVYP